MLFLPSFLVLALSQDTRAQLAPREVVDLTIEAGGLVGTGVIEFKSPSQERETPSISVTTNSGTPCTSTATYHTSKSTTPSSQDVAPMPTSVPVPFPLIPTTGHPGLNSSTRATPTPRPSAPVSSNAVTVRQATCASLVSLVVMECVFFFL
ncbi:hypothetical protein FMUND_614 [Fusarium mundagurra]|uniref:Uncharacterized protein n=1 Tax=Fusarium mundagurra TaxID=1567541 RepID=A0A8H6DPM2_9HYPO|nr:hypothetical protein FMUND_614 [Fusarium mundagurra]